jgi:hypothetical protein
MLETVWDKSFYRLAVPVFNSCSKDLTTFVWNVLVGSDYHFCFSVQHLQQRPGEMIDLLPHELFQKYIWYSEEAEQEGQFECGHPIARIYQNFGGKIPANEYDWILFEEQQMGAWAAEEAFTKSHKDMIDRLNVQGVLLHKSSQVYKLVKWKEKCLFL